MKKAAYKEMFENELSHGWYKGTRSVMIDFIKNEFNSNAKILDAGCGTGGTFIALKKNLFNDITVVDNSSRAISFLRKRRIEKIINSSINKLPFTDDSFDVIICLDVLYHKGVNIKKALNEFKRVLKPEGMLYLQEPAWNWLKSSHDEAIDTEKRFSMPELKNQVRASGFKIKKGSYLNTIFFPIIVVKRIFNKVFIKEDKSDVQPLPFLLSLIIEKAIILEGKIMNKISIPFGLSVIIIAQK